MEHLQRANANLSKVVPGLSIPETNARKAREEYLEGAKARAQQKIAPAERAAKERQKARKAAEKQRKARQNQINRMNWIQEFINNRLD